MSLLSALTTASITPLSGWKRTVMLIFLGAFTTLTLAPFYIIPLLFLTFPILIYHLKQAGSYRRAFWDGWSFGFGYFTTGLYWFAYALLVDAATFGWLIPFAVFGISGILGIYTGLASILAYRGRALPVIPFCLLFALTWTAIDILRSLILTGFPWNLLGYSMAATNLTIQLASIGGIWWVTLLTYTIASAPLWYYASHQQRKYALSLLAVSIGAIIVYSAVRLEQHPTRYHEDIQLRLVQAAIKQELKWSDSGRYDAFRQHINLSLSEGYDTITHILWPESAMTFRFTEGDRWAEELARIAPRNGSLITGVVRIEPSHSHNEPPFLFNSLQAITREGRIDAVYDKRKLVPFGEYIPLRSFLPLTKITHGSIDFSTGTSNISLSTAGAPPFHPLICYEAIFPWLSHHAYPAWLLNITNDGWFGISTGPYQHFHMARMRAVEQGVPLIRPANSGISAVIDPYGRILTSLGLGERGILDSKLPQAADSPTLYARYPYLALAGTVILYILLIFRLRKPDNSLL